ncbi:MAG: corrinoid protein [Proteobacteria bacterium]|nr:corrinoid protein [Pseudomonadota bacterium]
MTQEAILESLRQAILDGDAEQTQKVCGNALEAKVETSAILQEGMTKAMKLVGAKWDAKEFFLPEVLAAADAMKSAIEFMKPHLQGKDGGGAIGTAVIGTVKGDVHNIGKNLVALFMELGGFNVFNLGEDVSAEKFVQTALENNADVIGSSAFVSTVATEMARIEEGLKEAGIRDKVFTLVGGAVLDPEWAVKIGADAYGKDALHATQLAQEFVSKKRG